jgi:elongation factor Tu
LGAINGDAAWEEKVMELMDAVDSFIPIPPRDVEKPFLMPVEDVFSITGRGTVATGRIETGVVTTGDEVELLVLGPEGKSLYVQELKCSGKFLTVVKLVITLVYFFVVLIKTRLKEVWLFVPPVLLNLTPNLKLKFIFKKEEGGRHTPFHNNYRPQFFIRTLDVTGEIQLPAGTEMVMPGDNVTIDVELIYPVAVNQNLRFAIREGGRTVGAGQVVEIIRDKHSRFG